MSTRGYGQIIVAPSNADDGSLALADLVCDGINDNETVQDAFNALPSTGGVVVLLPGDYDWSAPVVLARNQRSSITGYGAKINLNFGATGFRIAQGVITALGARIEGVRINGQSNAGTTGIRLDDTNNALLVDVRVEGCAVGISLESNASGGFTEGANLINPMLVNNTIGLKFVVTNGTGSFAQTRVTGLRCTGSTTGVQIPNLAILQRSILDGTIWIDTNQTGLDIDGNVEDSTLRFGIEGAGGATGNVGLLIGSNPTNLDTMALYLLFTGTINTQITNASGKAFHYYPNANGELLIQTAGTVFQSYRRHGDATDRVRVEALTAGGKITFGNGTLLDSEIHRSAADIIASADQFQPASFKSQTKAGTPVDGDIVGGAADGNIVVDTTASKIWVRIGGAWKSVAVA